MRVLVVPHKLTVGGSQLVAIELAAAVRDRGHDVTVYGYEGPLVDVVEERGLPFVAAPPPHDQRDTEEAGPLWPSVRTARHLQRVAIRERVDVVHAYEWYPALEAFWGAQLVRRVPTVMTVLSMSVPWLLPRRAPLIVGTAELAERMRGHSRDLTLLEPPIDVTRNCPDPERPDGRDDGEPATLAIVSRLADWKMGGILAAVEAARELATRHPVRLVVAGDGAGFPELRERADRVNQATGEDTVVLLGEVADPCPVYAGADVVLGMGSSLLRGMAFAKPGIVVGAGGFAEVVGPQTYQHFLRYGFFGERASGSSTASLVARLEPLLLDPAAARELGAFGRALVCDRFSIEHAAASLETVYLRAQTSPLGRWHATSDAARSLLLLSRSKLVTRLSQVG